MDSLGRQLRSVALAAGRATGSSVAIHLRTAGLCVAGCSLRPPVILIALVIPDTANAGQDLFGEQPRVLGRQFRLHRLNLENHHQMADAEVLDRLGETISHRLGTAANDNALLFDLLPPGHVFPRDRPKWSRAT